MRSAAHIEGHPIHPMLIGFPVAYLFGSACLDAWGRLTGRRTLFRTAKHMNTLGLATAVVAAVPGLVDYVFAVPPKSSAKKRATDHMFANLSALTLFAVARAGRKRAYAEPRRWSVAAELAGAGLMSVGGWLGGTLVYRNQIAVEHLSANAGRLEVESHAQAGRIDAGAADELEVGQMKLVRIGARRIVVGRTEDGFVAFDDRCTHKGGPLSDGALVCGTVQCPWHGSQFDVEAGKATQGPAKKRIATYKVHERDGQLTITLKSEVLKHFRLLNAGAVRRRREPSRP